MGITPSAKKGHVANANSGFVTAILGPRWTRACTRGPGQPRVVRKFVPRSFKVFSALTGAYSCGMPGGEASATRRADRRPRDRADPAHPRRPARH